MKRGEAPAPRTWALLALAAALAAGCSRDVVHVESNTYWSGTINGNIIISGSGNMDYEMHGKLGCVEVSKSRLDTLYLRLHLNDRPPVETREPGGTVTQCN